MNTTQRRIALLTGASVAALGVPSVAQAAVFLEPSVPYLNIAANVADTVNICLDNPPNPDVGVECYYGMAETGVTIATAFVTNPLNGQLEIIAIAGTDVVLGVTNNNLATVQAFAHADGGLAIANASVDNGLEVFGIAGDDALVGIDNAAGALQIDATALAHGFGGTWGLANATVDGIVELAVAGDFALAAFDNDALVSIEANASATGTGASANASVDFGAVQIAISTGGGTASAIATNDGVFHVEASAFAVDTFAGGVAAFADATADGFLQLAVGGAAFNSYDNNGLLDVNATAIAIGPTFASANATVSYALAQVAIGTLVASNDLDNTGAIDADAFALALGGTFASAQASVNDVVVQFASASGIAVNDVDNSGDGLISGQAVAVASDAFASATVNSVIQQTAIGAVAGNFVSNTALSTITGSAVATAFGPGGNATASAGIGVIIDQNAFASVLAVNSVLNAGLIAGVASANANAFAIASANATVSSGIDQFASATGAATGTAVADINNTGVIGFAAIANAGGTGTTLAFIPATSAFAFASVNTGIDQFASATGTSSAFAVADIDNSGLIVMGAIANASASVFASAVASIDTGISQDAQAFAPGGALDIAVATASISNAGVIAMTASANAVATTRAFASVSIGTGIDQSASASAFFAATANALINNSGGIAINAVANAAALATATANASVALGIDQDASVSGVIAATFALANIELNNSGSIGINAVANAAALGFASANATVETGISQSATATGFAFATASISLVNSGTLGINASANAAALGFASANAEVSQGITQSASATAPIALANVVLTNSGTLGINAVANAAAVSTAFASASISSGITQNASASGSTAAGAFVQINNSGTLGLVADANAAAAGFATASAFVDTGISQNATATATTFAAAAAGIVNSGNLGIIADASAVAGFSANAIASVSTGISQSANASAAVATAVVTLDNSGALTIAANAFAAATSFAFASASVDTGISQSASATGTALANALVSINNSGTINIVANATALATGFVAPASGTAILAGVATASAFVGTGITQNANASAFTTATLVAVIGATTISTFFYGGVANATAQLTNTGLINIAANAFADAASAFAQATVNFGIGQFATATGGSDANANVSLVNGALATIAIQANADAIGTFSAVASASVDTGISQFAFASVGSGLASANVSLTNDGVLVIAADAFADANGAFVTAGGFSTPVNGFASASAFVDHGIFQSASAVGSALGTLVHLAGSTLFAFFIGNAEASVSLNNTGILAITADADAGGATAIAFAGVDEGIEQQVFASAASSANASASISNAGTMVVLADATAIGTFFANATASIGTGIDQFASASAFGPANAAVSLNNSGIIAVTVDAFASAVFTASAFAFIGQGIDQSAFATGSAGAASATLVNSGLIEISADASATAVSAFASASIGTGIQQSAFGNDTGLASLNNSGAIVITAEADAGNFGTSTFAGAFAFIGVGISQSATAFLTGGVATATLVNTGDILISVDADGALASDGSAVAIATIGTAIFQHASASSAANVGLVNDGVIDVLANAVAIADEDGTAVAGIGTVVFQSASAFGTGGDASVSLINNNELVGLANATVIAGNDVFVSAFVGGGVSQFAFGGTTGTANALLVNNGLMAFTADASGIGGGTGSAFAFASGGFQVAAAGGAAEAVIINTATMLVEAEADIFVGNAAQKGASAVAVASALGWIQVAAAATVTATGTLVFTTGFTAGALTSDTIAGVGFLATNTVTNTPSGPALALLDNTGLIVIAADASAVGDDLVFASANAIGFTQVAAGSSALSLFVNGPTTAATAGGTMVVAAHAFASGDNAATAVAFADAVNQIASAVSSVSASILFGTGTIHFDGATTVLTNINSSANLILVGTGSPTGHAVVALENSGIIDVAATATAIGNGNQGPVTQTQTAPFALAIAQGIDQFARGATATAIVENSGSLSVGAHALASGVTGASAIAVATGISQVATAVASAFTASFHLETVTATDIFGHTFTFQTFIPTASAFATTAVGAALVVLENSGSINVTATANAVGTSAFAGAFAAGVIQAAAGTVASASVTNSGEIVVGASAVATGTVATASAAAIGIGQFLAGTQMNATFNNSGLLEVVAIASAAAPAFATATGYFVEGAGGGLLTLDVVNTGDILVGAVAFDPVGTASANALGIGIVNDPTVSGGLLIGSPVNGFVTNAGLLEVFAGASGGTFTTTTAGGTFALSSANATGIFVASGLNNMTITNSGLLLVEAVTVHGGAASANGILVTANGLTTPGVGDFLTINNSGDIIVRISNDDGATFHRGMAIDVSDAPNNTVINLLGGPDGISLIYGNIDVQAGDLIDVEAGETVFNGIINPECMPAGGPTALVLDDPDQNLCGQGNLVIDEGGHLHLVIDPLDGPSYAFVNTFNMGDDGTIEFDLPSPGLGGVVPIGTYPQIFTEVANLDGTLIANIIPPANGLWDDTIYENVIDALDRNGTFDECIINGPPVGSLLLDADCIYDGLDNVDIGVFRTPFDAVPGLNQNGRSVGFGLECIYSTSLTGGIVDLLADLFLFTDPVNFNTALNMLAGEGYANYLQSFPSLGVHYNDLIDRATNCEVPALAGSILECRASSPIHLWGQLDYQWRKADGDSEAGTMKAKRFTGLIGGDARVAEAAVIGISVGYVTNNTRTNRFNEKMDGDGFQVGLYGAYDPGQFYVKAMATHSWYSGDSRRSIDFTGLAPGATFAGTTSGEPDVTMWTFGLHGGYRIGMGENSVLTPYLNYDYTNAKLKSFHETGLDGANLSVYGGSAKHSFVTVGAKWATQMGGVVPEVNLGYRHRFGEKRSDFRAAFLDDRDCAFDIISASQERGTFLAGLSVGGKMGPVDLRIGYEGEFNSDITSHAANFKIVLPLGGRAAPPPPPPVVAPPPPPPPVEAPPPPPPPPAPVERGERGQ